MQLQSQRKSEEFSIYPRLGYDMPLGSNNDFVVHSNTPFGYSDDDNK